MRFFAFICVFLFHGLPSNDVSRHVGLSRTVALLEITLRRAGENGVGLFFLLSAFLITELLRREKERTGSIQVIRFYFRRSLRIWPLYFLALTIGILIQPLSAGFRMSGGDILTYVFFLRNWNLHQNWNPIFILWTVSSEEQFYAVWPLVQQRLSERWMRAMCAVLLAAIPAIAFWPGGWFLHRQATQIGYVFLFFPLGGLLSFLLKGWRTPLALWRCAALIIVGGGMWFAGTLVEYPTGLEYISLSGLVAGKVIVVLGTVLVFFGFLRIGSQWAPRGLVYLGRISYGLYVFHIMALMLARWMLGLASTRSTEVLVHLVLALGLTVGAAMLSYEFFEKRFLLLKDRLAIVPSAPPDAAGTAAQ